jgi:hypothetical protein
MPCGDETRQRAEADTRADNRRRAAGPSRFAHGYDSPYLTSTATKAFDARVLPCNWLNALWASVGKASREVEQLLRTKASEKPPVEQVLPEKFLIVIECSDETDQREKLTWLKQAGVECRAVMS